MADAPIKLESVSHFYGSGQLRKQILHGIDIAIGAGEIVILTGPSGSGKTTLLTLIGALRAAQEGSVQVLGNELNNAKEGQLVAVRRQIGYIFQQHNLLESLTVSQNVQMAMELGGRQTRKDGAGLIKAVLDHVGMGDHLKKKPSQLSGGQKQRVGIARALVNHPGIILADEPTASLDKESGRAVVNLIQTLAREQGAAVVLVTHDNRILDVADRIIHLEDGRIQTLTEAVAANTSRMLNMLERHDPEASLYLAMFASSLARVAYVDGVVTDDEITTIKKVLHEVAELQAGEIDLVLELAMSHARMQQTDGRTQMERFPEEQREHFVSSLLAVAAADGSIAEEEYREIDQIALEYGFTSYTDNQRQRIRDALMAVAEADGRVSEEERERIAEIVDSLGKSVGDMADTRH
jgi:putative ABC transport system ATP-binding protein